MNLPSDMTMFKIFNVADLYEYHPTEQLYLDYNLMTSSFEEGGTDVGDQDRAYRQRQTQLSTGVLQSGDNDTLSCRHLPVKGIF